MMNNLTTTTATAAQGAHLNLTTPLLIIGAALPRTGTASIAFALEQLGYKVFHFATKTEPFWQIWDDICEAGTIRPRDSATYNAAFDKFVQQLSQEGFNATLDQPSCFVYERLQEYYPEAKVLQTVRDDASSWARSMLEMSYSMDLYFWQPPFERNWNYTEGPYGYWAKKQLGYRDEEIHPNGVPINSNPYNDLERKSSISMASAKVAYHRYHAKVRRVVPEDKLVTYNGKEGWGPLCQHFLPANRICPLDQEFPHLNDRTNSFLIDVRRMASARVHLHKIHPILAKRKWLINSVVFGMKQRRGFISFFQNRILHRGRRRRSNQQQQQRKPKLTTTTIKG